MCEIGGLGIAFTNPVGTGVVWDMSLGCSGVVWGSGLVDWDRVCEGGVVTMSVCDVSLDYLCRWQVQVSVYCARRCSILLHLIDICFLTGTFLWHISNMQTCLRVVVGPGLVSTSPDFMRSSSSQEAGPHAQNR